MIQISANKKKTEVLRKDIKTERVSQVFFTLADWNFQPTRYIHIYIYIARLPNYVTSCNTAAQLCNVTRQHNGNSLKATFPEDGNLATFYNTAYIDTVSLLILL